MSKELEAYDIVFNSFNNCTCQDGRFPVRSALDTIYQALKRNEPVTPIGVRHYNGIVERGLCPVCRMETYSGDKYCCECGTKFDKDWSNEK